MRDDLLRASPEEYHHATTEIIHQLCYLFSMQSTYILDDMAMVTDEQESTTFGHIDLHADQTLHS